MIDFRKYIKTTTSGDRPAFIKRWGLFLLLFTAFNVLLFAQTKAHAGNSNPREYEIKMAFIYNFAKYVTWPEKTFVDKNEPLVLCILGHNPFSKHSKKIEGKLVHKHKLKIRTISDFQKINECHLLYISPSESEKIDEIQSFLKSKSILTISDMDNFTNIGGMIELIVQDGKIRFIINPKAAEQAGLEISSQLLKLAIIAKQEQ